MSEQATTSRAHAGKLQSDAHQTAARVTPAPKPVVGASYEMTSYTGRRYVVTVIEIERNAVYARDADGVCRCTRQQWRQYALRRTA